MKIACQSCGAKYTIADEKVSGKTVKIKCKKCGATVVVDGHAQAEGGPGYGSGEAAAGADEWTVSVADDDQRTLTTEQIVIEYRNGVVGPDTFVWREGMPEWQPLGEVAELASLCGSSAPAPQPSAPAYAAPDPGYGVAASPAATPAAAAAVRKRGQSVDLFGGGGGGGAMDAAPAAPAGGSIGERNENSVLFSLSALTAAESAAKKGGGASNAPKPRVSGAPAAKAASSIDDIMNLGSGGISPGAALAPPPVNAPFIEPPPPPPPVMVAPAMSAGPASGYGAPMGMPMGANPYGAVEAPKKSPVGLIVGGVVGLVVIIGAVFMLTRGGGDTAKDKTAANEPAKTAETKADKPEKKEEPIAEAAKTAEPADTGAAPTADTAPANTGATASTGASPNAAGTAPKGGPVPPSTGTKKDEPKKEEPKKEEPKKEEPAAGGGTGNFDRGAASASLGSAAASAKGCKKDGGPTGSTKVQVTFAPSGRVTTVNVGAPFAGTPVGSCIASAFKSASVPPFAGAAQTVSKSVSIK